MSVTPEQSALELRCRGDALHARMPPETQAISGCLLFFELLLPTSSISHTIIQALRILLAHYAHTARTSIAQDSQTPTMVNYVRPKFITKTALKNAPPYVFGDAHLAVDAPPPRVPTCSRCFATIAKCKGGDCDRPDILRCKKCVKGHRAGCEPVCGLP
jgi:hypothetical protein